MRNIDKVLKHLNVNSNITHRDAISDYNMTGGSLTKYISMLREQGYLHTVAIGRIVAQGDALEPITLCA